MSLTLLLSHAAAAVPPVSRPGGNPSSPAGPFNRVVVTVGLGRRMLPTWGYGGLGAATTPPEVPETPWEEDVCIPAAWDEDVCTPADWEETGKVYERLPVTPTGTFAETLSRAVEVAIPPDIDRVRYVLPAASQTEMTPFRVRPSPMSGGMEQVPLLMRVVPGGAGVEQFPPAPDPPETITLQGVGEVDDTFLQSSTAGDAFGSTPFIFIRNGSPHRVALINFPAHGIPSSATIISATLTIWTRVQFIQTTQRTLEVNRLLRQWTEGPESGGGQAGVPNWNQYDTGLSWTVPGAGGAGSDYSAVNTATVAVQGTYAIDDPIDVVVTDVVQELVTAGDLDASFLLRYQASTVLQEFWSKEGGLPTTGPRLIVTYSV